MAEFASGRTIYSLWMLPPPDIADKLRDSISKLSEKFNTTAFEPHITLFPLLYDPTPMIVHKVKELCGKLKPFKIRFTKIECGQSFYQCVYILVELTPDLITANSMCRKLFQRFDDPPYKPHLSLLYGDPGKISADSISNQVDLNIEEIGEFMVDSVELWLTPVQKDKISEWTDFQRFHFGIPVNTNGVAMAKSMDNKCADELFPKDWGKGNADEIKGKLSDENKNDFEASAAFQCRSSFVLQLIDEILYAFERP